MSCRLPLLALGVTMALSACTIPVEIVHNPKTPQDIDCAGTDGICLVSDREAKQPLTTELLNQKIHEYLVAHPAELAQIMAAAQTQINQQKAAEQAAKLLKGIADHHDAIYSDPADPIIGNPNGDITVVEYFDDECPWCKKLAPQIERLITLDPNVRVVMKELSILDSPGVAMSTLAAKYALAANLQGKYAEFHHTLMASSIGEHQLTEDNLKAFAKSLGLNMAKLAQDIKRPDIAQHIDRTKSLAAQIGIGSTPTLLVDTIPHAANSTAEDLARDVAAIRQRNKNLASQKASS